MIYYENDSKSIFGKVFRCTGSVFPMSILIALPNAAIAAALQHAFPGRTLSFLGGSEGILIETQAWSGFTFLVGFLIVFRTSQAYSRFWEGCTASHQMRAEWFDASSSIIAFCKHSQAPEEMVMGFKQLLVRLMSMLHAAALADLERGHKKTEEAQAWKYPMIDTESMDSQTISTIRRSEDRVELIFEWVQQLVVENIGTGVLSVPPPLLSRSFQELANGMVQFHNAMKIAYIPFPFPYAQSCDCLLILHWLVVPLVTSQWVTNIVWAGVFCFIQVFILWSLNMIATEIENPFGRDPNDIDGELLQNELNRHLLMLLMKSTARTPRLSRSFTLAQNSDNVGRHSSFSTLMSTGVLVSERPSARGEELGIWGHSTSTLDTDDRFEGDEHPAAQRAEEVPKTTYQSFSHMSEGKPPTQVADAALPAAAGRVGAVDLVAVSCEAPGSPRRSPRSPARSQDSSAAVTPQPAAPVVIKEEEILQAGGALPPRVGSPVGPKLSGQSQAAVNAAPLFKDLVRTPAWPLDSAELQTPAAVQAENCVHAAGPLSCADTTPNSTAASPTLERACTPEWGFEVTPDDAGGAPAWQDKVGELRAVVEDLASSLMSATEQLGFGSGSPPARGPAPKETSDQSCQVGTHVGEEDLEAPLVEPPAVRPLRQSPGAALRGSRLPAPLRPVGEQLHAPRQPAAIFGDYAPCLVPPPPKAEVVRDSL